MLDPRYIDSPKQVYDFLFWIAKINVLFMYRNFLYLSYQRKQIKKHGFNIVHNQIIKERKINYNNYFFRFADFYKNYVSFYSFGRLAYVRYFYFSQYNKFVKLRFMKKTVKMFKTILKSFRFFINKSFDFSRLPVLAYNVKIINEIKVFVLNEKYLAKNILIQLLKNKIKFFTFLNKYMKALKFKRYWGGKVYSRLFPFNKIITLIKELFLQQYQNLLIILNKKVFSSLPKIMPIRHYFNQFTQVLHSPFSSKTNKFLSVIKTGFINDFHAKRRTKLKVRIKKLKKKVYITTVSFNLFAYLVYFIYLRFHTRHTGYYFIRYSLQKLKYHNNKLFIHIMNLIRRLYRPFLKKKLRYKKRRKYFKFMALYFIKNKWYHPDFTSNLKKNKKLFLSLNTI